MNGTNDLLNEFFHRILDVCCDMYVIDLQQSKQYYLDDQFYNRFPIDKDTLIILSEHMIQFFLTNVCQDSLNDFTKKEELDENVTRIATECLRIRRLQLFKAIAFRAASSRHGYLDNYDWSLVQVVCNDQMASMQSLLVKLTLVIVGADQQRRTLSIEMNKLELSSFIQILQLAEKDLQEQLLCKDVANLIVA
ncbi:COMM domain [Dermatophagoides farinae]|uniref:COMM domain n=1 Tax=Dermatophagoides farinae TaxID=6954 RepID=A0A922I5K4_DERFA|nr:COMM domain [Dermatophagoides farinae]